MMTTITISKAEELIERILCKSGFLSETARQVAQHLAQAEATGMTSHGINRMAYYLSLAEKRMLELKAQPRIAKQFGAFALVDGDRGLGIPAANLAMEYLISSTRLNGVAAAGLVNCGHTGRMGAYSEEAAKADCILISFGGAGRKEYPYVVPFGSREPFYSTNPFSFGAPAGDKSPAVLDFAASVVAQGKVAVAKAKGQQLPDGCIVDRDGCPTTDPDDFYDGGALLPFGGVKGSGMGLMAELISSAMFGESAEFNWLFLCVKADAFREMKAYRKDAESMISELHALKPAEGFKQVLMPGELEAEKLLTAQVEGLHIPESIWTVLTDVAHNYGVEVAEYLD
ncbi:Ldh family oxidoreductase [Kiloniella sp.]|uniref:Ldh family oxidoreductase n=1 Tax=Kiloniella sp. TaxID=1938587 RepID=UPI003B019E00